MRKPIAQFFLKLNSTVFVFILITVSILFFIMPKHKISQDEKRVLTQFPEFNTVDLFSGRYFKTIELYYSDNFIYRNEFIEIASLIKRNKGIKNNEIQYFTYSKSSSIKKGTEKDGKISKTTSSKDTLATESVDDIYENIKSVIVYKKKAIQIFNGSNYALSNFASLVKKYKDELGPSVSVFCMAIPIGSDFNLPSAFKKDREKIGIDHLYSVMDPSIKCVNAYEELRKHQKEYIQFNTDHHWTGRGAYYAYLAFCKTAQIKPLTPNKFEIKRINNFLGTLYYHTRSEDLKDNLDYVEYFKLRNTTKTTYFNENATKEYGGQLFVETAKGGSSYGVFLGRDYPLMKVKTDQKNGKKILIIKDSYGNAFSPFLCAHYEEVYIVDYRYLKSNIKNLIKKYGINNLLFAHNMYVLNSTFTISQESNFLTSNFITPTVTKPIISKTVPKKEPEKTVKDTIENKSNEN